MNTVPVNMKHVYNKTAILQLINNKNDMSFETIDTKLLHSNNIKVFNQPINRNHGLVLNFLIPLNCRIRNEQRERIPHIASFPGLVHTPLWRISLHDPPVGIRELCLSLHPPFHSTQPQIPKSSTVHASISTELNNQQIFSAANQESLNDSSANPAEARLANVSRSRIPARKEDRSEM